METTAEIIHPQNPRWSVFAESRAAGNTLAVSYRRAYPRSRLADGTVRKRGFDLEKREPVARLIEDLRTRAMTQAVECGASLVLRCKGEIDAAANVEDAQAIKKVLDDLETDARAAGVDGLQVRASVAALRIKFWEVLGRIRLQALGHLTRYARVKDTNGSGDAPVAVQINYAGPTQEHEGFPLPNRPPP